MSTSLIRIENNSQTLNGGFKLKFITGIEYERIIKKWRFGIKYEHGLNKINDYCKYCFDSYGGTGKMKENNIYLTTSYSILSLFKSSIEIKSGLGFYYSNLNYSGDFGGGISGTGNVINNSYKIFGVSPNLAILYNISDWLYFSVNASIRYGRSTATYGISDRIYIDNETVLTVPELRVGVNF